MHSCTSLIRRVATASLVGAGSILIAKQIARSRRKINFRGKTVLITGGSRGLGLALGHEFARQGARVAICARDEKELAAARAQLLKITADVWSFDCDLRDPEQIRKLISQTESACGPIDLLVNNAGTIMVGPARAMTIEDFQEAMAVNFWGAVHASLSVIPQMRARGFGRIVNIASVGGKMPVPHLAPYCASKFALVGFSASMRGELAKDNILITGVNAGLMRTGSPRNATFKGQHRAEYAWFSIADSLPVLSMSAATAARRIARAAAYGDAEVTLGLPAKVASMLYGLSPDNFIELNALANHLLPGDDDSASARKRGSQSESPITRSFLTALGRRAERKYNQ